MKLSVCLVKPYNEQSKCKNLPWHNSPEWKWCFILLLRRKTNKKSSFADNVFFSPIFQEQLTLWVHLYLAKCLAKQHVMFVGSSAASWMLHRHWELLFGPLLNNNWVDKPRSSDHDCNLWWGRAIKILFSLQERRVFLKWLKMRGGVFFLAFSKPETQDQSITNGTNSVCLLWRKLKKML